MTPFGEFFVFFENGIMKIEGRISNFLLSLIMNISFTPKTILYFLVFLWIVFSVVYIVNDIWINFKNVQMGQAYEQGRADTINVLIQEAEKCQSFSVFSGEKEIQLIKIGCPELTQ